MVHAKFYWTSGSEEEDFKGFGNNGHGSHLGHVTKTIFINLCPPFTRKLYTISP